MLVQQIDWNLAILADGAEHHVPAPEADNLLAVRNAEVFVSEADVLAMVEAVGNEQLAESFDHSRLRSSLLRSLVYIAKLAFVEGREKAYRISRRAETKRARRGKEACKMKVLPPRLVSMGDISTRW